MFSRPDDLADADVARVLAQGWGLIDVVVEYDAVGYGSHHWRVDTGARRWFATVDDLDARHRTVDDTRQTTAERLTTALTTAAALHKSGLDFVIAPEPSRNGTITEQLGERYVIALYRHVEGQSHPWSAFPGPSERLAVLDRLVHIHNTTPDVCTGALYDDFVIPGRDELEMALHDPEMEWGPGPFADAARVLLAHHGRAVTAALEWYDGLVETVLSRSGPMVLTHGEPHRGNTIDTASGVVLIDWDTALLAPPERDLWILINEDPGIADAYTACTGVAVDDGAVDMYRWWWDLCEVSLFAADLRRPHRCSADTRIASEQLTRLLQSDRFVP
jgi:spectinomycin phosphotransferase